MSVPATIVDDEIDFSLYMMPPEERARIISPGSLNERVAYLASKDWKKTGLSLPWAKTNTIVRLRRGKLYMWAGYSHHGKTAAIKQLVNHGIQQGEKFCVASLEELPEETFYDIACQAGHTQTPSADWVDVYSNYMNHKLWLYDQQNMIDPMRMVAVMNYCAKEKGVTHFVIDSLMKLDMDSDAYNMQRKFFHALGMNARALNVGVHIVAHVRKGSDDSKPPSGADIKGASELYNQADGVFIVWRNKIHRADRGVQHVGADALLIVDKQRGKPNWIGKIALWMDEESGQFLSEKEHPPQWYFPTPKWEGISVAS